jgi:ATP-dependent protease ClpP protease subunit
MTQGTGYKLDQIAKYDVAHDYVSQIHVYGLDIEMNHVYLMGEESYVSGTGTDDTSEPGVEFIMANKFIRNMNICMRKNPNVPILVHMKTNGGHWEEGMAIHNTIKACPNPVTILCYTHARSMSSIILQAANKRVMMPDSEFMFHDGTWGFEGTVRQARTEIKRLNAMSQRMLDIYVESMKSTGHCKNWSRKRIEEYLIEEMQKHEEVYLTPQETVKYGLADEIFGNGQNGYDWSKLVEYTDEQLDR